MEGIQSCVHPCRCSTEAAPIQFQGESARLACLNVSEDQSADINIVTAEGDKVTLSSDLHSEATLLTYEHLAYSNSGYETEEGRLVDYNEERNVAVSVEGELNDEELSDILALLSDLGQMLKAFLTGMGEGSVEENSADVRQYGSLAAFEADFEYHASLQYLNVAANQMTVEAAGLPGPSEAMPTLQPAASIAPAGAESPQPVAPAAPTPASPLDQPPAPAVALEAAPKAVAAEDEEAVRALAKRVKESGLKPRRFMKLLKKFLRGLMKEMRANHSLDDGQAKRGESILENFFGQLEKPSSVSEIKATRVSLKQQWVSLQYELKADVQMQPSVEETV